MPTQYVTLTAAGVPQFNNAPSFGIGVPDAANNHQVNVMNALVNVCHNNPAGQNLINSIVARVTFLNGAARVGIVEWDAQNTNKCAVIGNGDDAKAPLALAMEFQQANVAAELTAALVAVAQAGNHAWLAGQICAHPLINIVGVPAVAASHLTHGANWVTANMVQDWANGNQQFPAPLVGQQAEDAHLITVAVLSAGLGAGPGVHTRAHWSNTSVQYTDTLGAVHQRPPHIALAHELVHAYRNIMGTQVGHEIGTYTRVLYEWSCIGLGDWAAAVPSENAVRAGGGPGLPLRALY